MKKCLYILVGILILSTNLFADNHMVYYSESFAKNMPEEIAIYDEDGQKIYFTMIQAGFDQGDAWKCLRESGTENYYAASTSKYKVADGESLKPSDDWLVLPKTRIFDNNAVLKWRANSISDDSNKGDTYHIFISTSGNKPENFTSQPIFSVEEETINNWTNHYVSLEEYAGQEIYIAFVNRSSDCEILAIDDIEVSGGKGSYEIINTTPDYLFDAEEFKVTAKFKAYKQIDADKLIFHLSCEGNNQSQEVAISEQISEGTEIEFSFDEPISIKVGETIKYELWAEVGNIAPNRIIYETKSYLFEPTRRTVIEEGTGMWCRYCPLGIVAIERMKEKYGGSFIPIALHYSDILAVPEYVEPLMFEQYPSGWINRKVEAQPMLKTIVDGKEDYTMEGGWETFFIEAQKETTCADISSEAYLDEAGNIKVVSKTRFAIPFENSDFRHIIVVVEDGVEGYQENGFADTDYSLDGYENMDSQIKPFIFDDVARGIAEDWQGIKGAVPSAIEAGEEYLFEYSFEAPRYNNADNLRVVVMLLDMQSGEIVNATQTDMQLSGINNLTTQRNVLFANNTLRLCPDRLYSLSVYTSQGKLAYQSSALNNQIDLSFLPKGFYVATIEYDNKKETIKIIIK